MSREWIYQRLPKSVDKSLVDSMLDSYGDPQTQAALRAENNNPVSDNTRYWPFMLNGKWMIGPGIEIGAVDNLTTEQSEQLSQYQSRGLLREAGYAQLIDLVQGKQRAVKTQLKKAKLKDVPVEAVNSLAEVYLYEESPEIPSNVIGELRKRNYTAAMEEVASSSKAPPEVIDSATTTVVEVGNRVGTESLVTEILRNTAINETGTADYSGMDQIAREANGTKSYGILGLNSGAQTSGTTFIEKFGDDLGLTAPIGSDQFDQQWRALARTNPDALLDAHEAYAEQELIQPVQRLLSKAGLGNYKDDPGMINMASDMLVQYGPRLTQSNLQKGKDKGSTDVQSVIRDIGTATIENVDSNFKTHLKEFPDQRQGLINRLNNRAEQSVKLSENFRPSTVRPLEVPPPSTAPITVQSPEVVAANNNDANLPQVTFTEEIVNAPTAVAADATAGFSGGVGRGVVSGGNEIGSPLDPEILAPRQVDLTQPQRVSLDNIEEPRLAPRQVDLTQPQPQRVSLDNIEEPRLAPRQVDLSDIEQDQRRQLLDDFIAQNPNGLGVLDLQNVTMARNEDGSVVATPVENFTGPVFSAADGNPDAAGQLGRGINQATGDAVDTAGQAGRIIADEAGKVVDDYRRVLDGAIGVSDSFGSSLQRGLERIVDNPLGNLELNTEPMFPIVQDESPVARFFRGLTGNDELFRSLPPEDSVVPANTSDIPDVASTPVNGTIAADERLIALAREQQRQADINAANTASDNQLIALAQQTEQANQQATSPETVESRVREALLNSLRGIDTSQAEEQALNEQQEALNRNALARVLGLAQTNASSARQTINTNVSGLDSLRQALTSGEEAPRATIQSVPTLSATGIVNALNSIGAAQNFGGPQDQLAARLGVLDDINAASSLVGAPQKGLTDLLSPEQQVSALLDNETADQQARRKAREALELAKQSTRSAIQNQTLVGTLKSLEEQERLNSDILSPLNAPNIYDAFNLNQTRR